MWEKVKITEALLYLITKCKLEDTNFFNRLYGMVKELNIQGNMGFFVKEKKKLFTILNRALSSTSLSYTLVVAFIKVRLKKIKNGI